MPAGSFFRGSADILPELFPMPVFPFDRAASALSVPLQDMIRKITFFSSFPSPHCTALFTSCLFRKCDFFRQTGCNTNRCNVNRLQRYTIQPHTKTVSVQRDCFLLLERSAGFPLSFQLYPFLQPGFVDFRILACRNRQCF